MGEILIALMVEGRYNVDEAMRFTIGAALSVIIQVRKNEWNRNRLMLEENRKLAFYTVAPYLEKDSKIDKASDLYPLPWDIGFKQKDVNVYESKKNTKKEAFELMNAFSKKSFEWQEKG